ncbi:MAG: HEAT repeat domain-containing protein [Terriglobia bacterium]
MKCQAVREQLSLYLYDELAAEPRAALAAHLKDCTACTQALAEEERLHALLRERPLPEPSPELLVECRAVLEENLAEEALGWRALLRAWLGGTPVPAASQAFAVLAVLVLGFGAGWTLRSQGGAFSGGNVPAATRARLGADLSGARISGIRQVAADPQTGRVRVILDAEQRMSLEGTLADPQIQRILIYTVKNYGNPGIRRESLGLLRAGLSTPEVRGALIYALLNDENAGMRREAFDALSGLKWEAPIRQALIQVLEQDNNPGLRVAAINLLAERFDESVLPVFRRLAEEDRNPYVRWKCDSALRSIAQEKEY